MITLIQSNTVIEAALARARELGLPPVGAAVLDSGGHLKAFQAEDGLNFLRVRICSAKAWGALGPDQTLIGAVGVSGALPEQDEECARAGIEALERARQ